MRVNEKEKSLSHPLVQKEVFLFFPLEELQTFGEKIGQDKYKEER